MNILGKEMKFENLKSGHSTNYINVSGTYRYCFVKVIVENDMIEYRPIDYVGETLYKSGKMTFLLKMSIDGNNKRHLEIDSERSIF